MGTRYGNHFWKTDDGAILPVHTDTNGVPRILGALPPRARFGAFPRWRDAMPVLPRSKWLEVDYSHYAAPKLNQGRHGSCVGHGAVTGLTRVLLMAGRALVRLSACFVYGQINGDVDQGAIVSDAMEQLLKGGACLEETVPEGMIYRRQFPQGAAQEALRWRAGDCYHAKSFDELCTGLIYGFIPVYGIWVGENFGDLDGEGVAPVGGRNEGGHCMTGFGLKALKRGDWAIDDQNSWDTSWGNDGCCRLVEGHFTYKMQLFGGLDAFLIRAPLDDPQDRDNPPVAA